MIGSNITTHLAPYRCLCDYVFLSAPKQAFTVALPLSLFNQIFLLLLSHPYSLQGRRHKEPSFSFTLPLRARAIRKERKRINKRRSPSEPLTATCVSPSQRTLPTMDPCLASHQRTKESGPRRKQRMTDSFNSRQSAPAGRKIRSASHSLTQRKRIPWDHETRNEWLSRGSLSSRGGTKPTTKRHFGQGFDDLGD